MDAVSVSSPPGPGSRRRRRRAAATAAFVVIGAAAGLLPAAPASAAVGAAPSGVTRVISASGTIDASCGSGIPAGTPVYATVQSGVTAATASASTTEVVYVCAGTYNEAVTADKQGIDIVGPNWNDPTGGSDAAVIKPPAGSPAIDLGPAATTNVSIKGLTIDGGTYGVLSRATSGSALAISNNIVKGQTLASIETRGIDGGSISGNDVEPAANGDGIVTKDAAGALNIQSNTIAMTGPNGVGVSLISTPTSGGLTSGGQTVGGAANLGNTITGGATGVLIKSADQSTGAKPYTNGATVTFNDVSGSSGNGVKVDGAGTALSISDNTIASTGASGINLAGPTGVAGYSLNNVQLYRNTITDAGRDGIEATGYLDSITAGYTAGTGNTITDPGRNGVTVDGFPTTAVTAQNTRTNSATTIRVASNTISGAGNDGVSVKDVDSPTYIWWNDITDSTGDGVSATNSDWVSTAFNNISGNGGDGVNYDDVFRVYVYQNDIAQNGGDGVNFVGKSTAVYAWLNTVNDNAGRGIAYDGAAGISYNDIRYNNVAGNAGLDCADSSSGVLTSPYNLGNFWYANTGGADSSPAGLCGPDQLTVNAPQWDGEVGNPYVGAVPVRPVEASAGPVTWSIVNPPPPDPSIPAQPDLPAGLTLNAATGQITGTPSTPVTAFTVLLMATDSAGKTGTYVARITIYPKLIGDDDTVNGTTGTPIAPFTPTITGGNPATTKGFSVAPGSASALPPGLSLDPTTGEVTGTPTVPGTYRVTFKVTDNSPNMEDSHDSSVPGIELPPNADTYDVVFTVAPGPVDANGSFGTAIESASYSSTAPTATGGDGGPYTWSTTSSLPSGLTLNPTTGVISGTPASGTAGSYPITLTATDGSGTSGSFTATLTVLPPDPGIPMANPAAVAVMAALLGVGVLGAGGLRRRFGRTA